MGPKLGMEMLIESGGARGLMKVMSLVLPVPKLALFSEAHVAASSKTALMEAFRRSILYLLKEKRRNTSSAHAMVSTE